MKLASLSTAVKALVPAVLLLGLWGYAYEYSYFRALDLNVLDTLRALHFVLSAGSYIVPMLVIILIYVHLGKFFTKRVYEDDTKVILKQLESTTFEKEIFGARLAVMVSVIYWLSTVLLPKVGVDLRLGTIFLYLTFVNLQFFLPPLLLSPPHSRMSVLVAFVVSVTLCFSAGGYGFALNAKRANEVIRDDFLVRIVRSGGAALATVKPTRLPIPALQRLLERLAGE